MRFMIVFGLVFYLGFCGWGLVNMTLQALAVITVIALLIALFECAAAARERRT